MNEIEIEIDKELEDRELKAEVQTGRGLEIVKLGKYTFVATKNGAEFLDRVKKGFDLVSEWDKKRQECQKIDLEREQKKESEGNEKVRFFLEDEIFDGTKSHTIYKIPFETTRKGLEEFKRIMNKPKERKKFERSEEIETLSFFDGVILVREIFGRIVDEYFDDDEKDRYGGIYKECLWDKMEDVLDNNVLNHARDHRAEHLHSLFEIRNRQYVT